MNRKEKYKKAQKKINGWDDIDNLKTPSENMIFGILKKHPKTVFFVISMFFLYVADLVVTILMAFKII